MVRITQNLLSYRTLYNLQNSINRVATIQDQLSTGRRVNRPSDDPIDFPFSLSQRTTINLGQSHMRNINNARSNLDLSEASLNSLTEVVQSVRQLAVQGANETNDAEARLALSDQVKELYGEIINLANSNFNGRYIFGGSTTTEQPFVDKDGEVLYQGDDFKQQVSISIGATLQSNVTGLDAFMHTPNQITATLEVNDITKPLAEEIQELHPDYPNIPELPGTQPGSTIEASPNPENSPTSLPNNYADFSIYGTTVRVDLSVDSLEDIKNRINNNVEDVTASIDDHNRLVITSHRSDPLELQEGNRDIGFEPQAPQGSNVLSVLGLNRKVESQRSLNLGYPSTDPITDGTVTPAPERSTIRLQGDAQLFVSANTGYAGEQAVPYHDNMALTDVDADGNELLDGDDNPVFLTELEAIRVTIDEETFDIDLRALTTGYDFDGTAGNEDDIPGSDLQDMLDLINNHPQMQGKATAFINAEGTGLTFSATGSADTFEVSSVRKLFGRDITTQVEVDPNTGRQTVSSIGELDYSTKLEDIPGAMVDGTTGDSLGIRTGEPLPGIDTPATNNGIISINNDGEIYSIDLREATTIGDVIRTINESPAQVQAELNATKTGINITPLLDDGGTLTIQDVEGGTTARDLGLFAPPSPVRIQDNFAGALTQNSLISTHVPGMVDGEFSVEVRDGVGNVLETYTVPVERTDTMEEIAEKIDGIDGVSGQGGGLITAQINNGELSIVSNYDGHSIYIDAASDTTGTDETNRVTQVLGIDQYTATAFNGEEATIYSSSQSTAEILGVAGEGEINEVEEGNIFSTIKMLETGLRQDDTSMIQEAITRLDEDLEAVLLTRTSVGSRLNRLDSTQLRLEEAEDLVRQQLSYVEDADLAELITELTVSENAFNASLQVASRVIQQSLINFLS